MRRAISSARRRVRDEGAEMNTGKHRRKITEDDVVEGPAVITGEHVQDRVLSPRAGAKKGWSKLATYEKEFRRGSLVCKERCTGQVATREEEARALDRFAAARAFDQGW